MHVTLPIHTPHVQMSGDLILNAYMALNPTHKNNLHITVLYTHPRTHPAVDASTCGTVSVTKDKNKHSQHHIDR